MASKTRPLMVQSMGSKSKLVDLEKEMSVVSDMLEESFPRRRGRKPPTTYFPMKEESTIECKKPSNLEKEGKVVFEMLEGFFPRRGGERKPSTTYSSMEEVSDSNQAAIDYPTPKVVNKHPNGSKFYYRRGF